jgi:hypothetical protein
MTTRVFSVIGVVFMLVYTVAIPAGLLGWLMQAHRQGWLYTARAGYADAVVKCQPD